MKRSGRAPCQCRWFGGVHTVIAGTQHDHLVRRHDEAEALGAVQHLAGGVGVPGRVRAGGEVDGADAEPGLGMATIMST